MIGTNEDEYLNALWVEKYRPHSINDVVMPEENKIFLSKCLERQETPHLLFSGPAGSGKTSISRVLLDSLVKSEMDILSLNGSDTNGIEVVRNSIVGFLKSPPYKSKFKYVFIDEFDGFTSNAQQSLRAIMESYADTGRFICTCNYLSKIIDPLQSRFTLFEVKRLSPEYIKEYVEKILKTEKIDYDSDTIDIIIQSFAPDVRKIINTLQRNINNKKLKKISLAEITTNEKKICGLIVQICDAINTPQRDSTMNQNMPQIMECLTREVEPDYRQMYQTLFFHPQLPMWCKIKVNQYQNLHGSCALPSAHFTAMIFDAINAGIMYFQMFKK